MYASIVRGDINCRVEFVWNWFFVSSGVDCFSCLHCVCLTVFDQSERGQNKEGLRPPAEPSWILPGPGPVSRHACMHVCVCVCVCVCVSVSVFVRGGAHVCAHSGIGIWACFIQCEWVCLCVWMCVCVCARAHASMCMCVYMCGCVHACECACVHTQCFRRLMKLYVFVYSFFQDGLKTLNHFQGFVEGLLSQLVKIKQRQEHERKQLLELRDALKGSMTSYKEVRTLRFFLCFCFHLRSYFCVLSFYSYCYY